MSSKPVPIRVAVGRKHSQAVVLAQASHEVVFAVVGHVGSGTSEIAEVLRRLLTKPKDADQTFEVEMLKATDVISSWAKKNGKLVPSGARKTLADVERFQDLGDEMRSGGDFSIVARELILEIRQARAKLQGVDSNSNDAIQPDGKKRRAYILDSIRHPAEVELLRHVYQDAFFLIGVVCDEQRRLERVMKKYEDAGAENAAKFMKRDAKASQKHGQRVSDAFQLSDFFVDNTADQFRPDKSSNPGWDLNDRLSRLIKIITHTEIVRPLQNETAMFHAHAAALRSACLSRQVGAALIDSQGNVLATGSNEVPRAGGGVYGEGFHVEEEEDHRCAYRHVGGEPGFCSNTRQQNVIIENLVSSLSAILDVPDAQKSSVVSALKAGGIGDLIEFSRAVHAEMDAILTAGREGVSLVGSRLFVTTFPCHYCARHVVSAGVDEVQYIEAYPKSLAIKLHSDSIETDSSDWTPPSKVNAQQLSAQKPGGQVNRKVLFHPFSGVAPRLYRKAFVKDRDLKNNDTGDMTLGQPDWGTPWHLRRVSYVELEADLFRESK
jgi:deoxycytidylate deaminase